MEQPVDILPIPLLDLQAQYSTIRGEIDEAICRVVESQHFILGPEVKALEDEIAAYSHCTFGIGVSSGTDALLVALMALGIGLGDEVITTPYTFFATAGAIARLGAKPVFADIDPETFNIDPREIEAGISERTRVIIPVHLFGQTAEMHSIMQIAEQHHLAIIEDAAQAIGAEYQGRRAGSMGRMGCFSFFPSKNLGGFGDGGMVTTNDPVLDDRLRIFRNHGYKPKYFNSVVGGNFRLDAIQAAILRVKLRYLDNWTRTRQQNAATYRRLFTDAGLVISLEALAAGERGVVLPFEAESRRHIYNQFVIRCQDRDRLMHYLKQHQIGAEIYYPCPMHLQECFSNLGYRQGSFPASEAAANQTLALPIYSELTEAMLVRVVDRIAQFYERY